MTNRFHKEAEKRKIKSSLTFQMFLFAFVYSKRSRVNKNLMMTGFEPGSSDIGSNCSVHCATASVLGSMDSS